MTYFDRDSELFEGALSFAMIELEKINPIRLDDFYLYYDANDETTKYIFELRLNPDKTVHCTYTLDKNSSINDASAQGYLRSRAMIPQNFMELIDTFIVTGKFSHVD